VNLYGYVMNDPVNLIDPNGNLAFLVAVPAIAGAIWAAAELALSAWDIINLVRDLFDSCVSWGEWGASAGLTALGIVGPGGGYGQAAKAFNKNQDALIQLAKEAKNKGGVDSEDAKTLLDWANEYGVEPALDHTGAASHGWKGKDHIRIGPVNHIKVR